MSPPETREEKGHRLVLEGKVQHWVNLEGGSNVWTVFGDSGKEWRVTVDPVDATDEDRFGWMATCTCPFMHADCAHALAVLEVVASLGPPNVQAGPSPNSAEDLHPSDNEDPQTAGLDEDPDDGVEVLGDAPALPVVSGEQRRDLMAIASAPVTFRTLEALSQTEFVPKALRGRPGAVLGAVLLGREYGLGPLEALRNIDVIDGSPSPSAELLLRLYRRRGHKLEVVQADDQAVELVGTRQDTGESITVRFTVADAERAGLVKIIDGELRARSANNRALPWEAFTPDLLWARAVSRLVRRLAPDCTDRPDPELADVEAML